MDPPSPPPSPMVSGPSETQTTPLRPPLNAGATRPEPNGSMHQPCLPPATRPLPCGADDPFDESDSERPYRRQRTDSFGLSPEYARDWPSENEWEGRVNLAEEITYSQNDNPPPSGALTDPRGLKQRKSVQDRVHGQIVLEGLCVAVMDTAEFQRLDSIKQLGGCQYVYPSASHSRKEHSIGVAHLAAMQVRHLREEQPHLPISDDDARCIELAGLVHDLGHGPFSHMFERFLHQVGEKGGDSLSHLKHWEHEPMSSKLLRLLIDRNDIPVGDYFSGDDGITPEQHINFVCTLISGLKDDDPLPKDTGRTEEQRFLYDIVSNSRNGIDVDKLDYLVRDSMAAFGSSKPPGFDIYRIIRSSRVVTPRTGPCQICFQQKVVLDINEIYTLRSKLHRQVYQHRIANVAEAMITDILYEARESFSIRDSQGHAKLLHEAAQEEDAFVRLTDSVLDAIWMSTAKGLERSEELLKRLKSRRFYRQVGTPVTISTLPACAHCGEDTALRDKFCSKCGRSTATRKKCQKKDDKTGEPRGAYVAAGVMLTSESAKEQILRECLAPRGTPVARDEWLATVRRSLYVHIVDIQHGKRTTFEDAHGHRWEVYDPLARVGFFNPKQPEKDVVWPTRDGLPELYVPSMCFQRTLYCYCKDDEMDSTTLNCIREGIGRWQEAQRHHEQLVSNVGTPMSQPPRQLSERPSRAMSEPRKLPFNERIEKEPAPHGDSTAFLAPIDE